MAKGESPLNSSDDKNLKYIPIDDSNEKEQFYDKLLFVISVISMLMVCVIGFDHLNYSVCCYVQPYKIEPFHYGVKSSNIMPFWREILNFINIGSMLKIMCMVVKEPSKKDTDIFKLKPKIIWYIVSFAIEVVNIAIVPPKITYGNAVLLYRFIEAVSFVALLLFNRLSMKYIYNKKSEPYKGVDDSLCNKMAAVMFIGLSVLSGILPWFLFQVASNR